STGVMAVSFRAAAPHDHAAWRAGASILEESTERRLAGAEAGDAALPRRGNPLEALGLGEFRQADDLRVDVAVAGDGRRVAKVPRRRGRHRLDGQPVLAAIARGAKGMQRAEPGTEGLGGAGVVIADLAEICVDLLRAQRVRVAVGVEPGEEIGAGQVIDL